MTQIFRNVSADELAQIAEHLRTGGLVAFPTETVYGLGAHAGDPAAVRRIYEVKGRPPTDPLIVHVSSTVQAEELIDRKKVNEWQRAVLRCLATAFWPGPLTLIVPADLKRIAFEVTSSTGWVGLRQPAHPLAQDFLRTCGVPVAAPSANLFGHVSPTTAAHVTVDFPRVDKLWIIDGGRCGFGIESTVVRLNENGTLDIFRRGGVGAAEITDNLKRENLIVSPLAVNVIEKYSSEKLMKSEVAPGQSLVHYAPGIMTQMISWSRDELSDDTSIESDELRRTVILDFAGLFSGLEKRVSYYRDLSPSGDVREAVFSLFDALRWAESCGPENRRLWIFDPRILERQDNELFLALQDRIIRCSSGRTLQIQLKPDSGRVSVSIR